MRLSKIRNSFTLKAISLTMVIILVGEFFAPLKAYALTGGPSQPEVQSFEPIGTTDMVDAFSGDFTYNIPLLDVDGYPINLSYHSGVGMDQEASWCGLGWNINPGVVNRNIRGIPDDFAGEDKVTKESNVKANQTFRVDLGASLELIGFDSENIDGTGGTSNANGAVGGLSVSFGLGIYYNNYRGMGYSLTAGANMNIGPLGLGAQMGFDNQSGIDFSPNVSLTARFSNDANTETAAKGGVSMGYNSRGGLRQLTFSASLDKQSKTKADGSAKVKGGSAGINGGGSIDFASPSYIPNVTPGMYSYAFTLTGKLGVSIWALDPTFSGSVNYSENGVNTKTRDYQAYGYLYADRGVGDDYAMQDLTREKEGGFTKYRQYLPLSTHSYDVYSVSGQGTGGVFRPLRGNIGTIYDSRADNENWPSVNITIEAGGGPPPSGKLGGNIKVAWSEAHSGIWRDGNNSLANLTFQGESVDDLFEPVYFKNAGEKAINDVNHYAKYGNERPVRVDLTDNVDDALANPIFVDDGNGSYPINSSVKRTTRDRRNQVITYLTADMASSYALEKTIKNYKRSASGGPSYSGGQIEVLSEFQRQDSDRKKHHVSEVTSINPDGTRYVYGIPAYNFVQVEKTFNVQDIGASCSTGLIEYTSTGGTPDNTLLNQNGIDNYYSATKLPPYAHSYLLTSVLSADYIDITGNGPTEDDYGTYTKLNYSAANTKTSPYKWRTPFYDANHNEGQKSDNSAFELSNNRRDDKGSYLYGEKEVWYLNSIETKNYIAEFYVSARRDAWGVSGENQEDGQDTTHMGAQSMKLDSIKLYSRFDRILNTTSAVPIKVVHFAYDYSLCKNVHNAKSGVGKLTLKRVWFTYGNTSRGSLNDYEFTYSSFNPDYNMKAYDRWGNYKRNPTSCDTLQNGDFPYVNQDNSTKADTWASAWQLTSMKLPSGGKVDITYESDDYAYVQNKPAMQMLKLKGFGDDTTYINNNSMFGINFLEIDPCEYIYFQMDKKYNTSTEVQQAYQKDMQVMYYNFLTNLTDNINPNERSEYVAGYCEILDAGVSNVSDSIGWVKIKEVPIGDREGTGTTHPAVKAALQYLRVNCSELAYPPEDPNLTPSIFDIVGVVFQFLAEIKTMILGFNRDRMLQKYCRVVNLQKSWIRLYEDSGFKKGGGSRVGQITFSDEWSSMTSSNEPSFQYGQDYNYSMIDPQTGKTISSGVASYEPTIGGDENPWRMPIKYVEEIAGAPNNDFYVETPLGESYFPSPSVGYRRVEISNIKHTGVNKRRSTGKMVYEFYTTAEFPTITKNTTLDPEVHKPFSLFSFFGLEQEEFATASQGYVIELNDMDGKPKAQWNYSENDATQPLSGVEYFYKLNSDNVLADYGYTSSKLNNTVTVLNVDGTYGSKMIGEEIDMVVDANEKEEHNFVVGAQVNVDGFLAVIIPIVIPMILPEYSSTHNRVKTITATKVVNRYGILQKTVAHDNGATLATENLAWDAETGEVLLTKTQNEYRDDIYNLTYPAHWAYDRMGQAYKNAGALVNLPAINAGLVKGTNLTIADILVPGDELGIVDPAISGTGETKLWVLDVNNVPSGTDSISFIFRDGTSPTTTSTYACRILRSGRRNMQALPIMNLTSRTNILGAGSSFIASFTNILSSSGAEYSEDWQMFRPNSCDNFEGCSPDSICNLGSSYQTYYVYMMNEWINQNRLNTSNSYLSYLATPFWSYAFTQKANVSSILLNPTCSTEFKTKGLTTAIGSFSYSGFEVTVDPHSCSGSMPIGWCTEFKVYSTISTTSTSPAAVTNLIDNVAYFIPTSVFCGTPNMSSINYGSPSANMHMTAVLNDGRKIPVYVTTHCFFGDGAVSCDYIPQISCCRSDSILNPYIWNLKGNWRPLRNFVYFDKVDSTYERKQSETVSNNFNSSFTKTDGTVRNYKPLWKYVTAKWQLEAYNSPSSPWTWQSMITIHSPFVENENKDALNIYSAAVYGYNQTLPIAVAKNALMRQIAYEGFEDHYMNVSGACPYVPHFSFDGGTGVVVTSSSAHTGKYSLKLNNNDTVSINRAIRNYSYTSVSNDPIGLVKNFKYKPQHLIEAFSPLGTNTSTGYTYGSVSAKKCDGNYIVSYWVKTSSPYGITGDPLKIYVNNSLVTLTSTGNDQVVENWKRIERSFNISSATPSNIRIKLTNTTGVTMYYDDIRIHPFNSSMKTFAYDWITQRLMAQLDDNNYATFYEYDEQGNLVRVKKETEKGVMTIQESRQSMNNH
jgi:hypothetical protein